MYESAFMTLKSISIGDGGYGEPMKVATAGGVITSSDLETNALGMPDSPR